MKPLRISSPRECARVVVCGLPDDPIEDVAKTIRDNGGEAVSFGGDISEEHSARECVDLAIKKFKRIDVLVNNAGVLQLAPLENISEERWDDTLAVHLKGTFNCIQAVIPFMKQQKKGKIINIAAPSALRGSFGVADYAAAKGGIIALTKNAASELKPHNIQVNCISPVADTRLTEELTKFRREHLGIPRRQREYIAPEAIAPAFLFFATADSDYVSGQLIEVGRI